MTRCSLLLSTVLLVTSCFLTRASAAATPICPIQVNRVLASRDYVACRQDVASPTQNPWVLSHSHAHVLAESSACQATLHALQAIEFDACVASLTVDDSAAVVRVRIEKASIHSLAASPITRRLRYAMRRLQDGNGDATSSFNYNYIYGAIAIFVVVLLVSCLLSRGSTCCFCIPIPLCC